MSDEAEKTYSLTVRYAAGHEQTHPSLSAGQIEAGVSAFLSDIISLKGRGITKFAVEIEQPIAT